MCTSSTNFTTITSMFTGTATTTSSTTTSTTTTSVTTSTATTGTPKQPAKPRTVT